MKTVHLNESKFNIILENSRKLPFKTFYDELVKFIASLLNDPINAKPSETLKSCGLDGKTLRKELFDHGVITKDEDIREPYDEKSGKKTSRYYVSYKVPRENFKEKLRGLYDSLTKKSTENVKQATET